MDTSTLPSAASAETALNSYQMPSSDSLLSAAQAQYGIPQLQSRVQGLQTLTGNLTNAIQAVDPSVTGRTAGTLTTEAQRSALVNREQQPLQTDLAGENQALGTASSNLNTANSNASTKASADQQDAQNKYNQLLQTYNIANARETATAQTKQQQAANAEAVREFNVQQATANSNASSAAATNAGKGYNVKQLSSGNKAYTGPNGQTNLYQYAAALANGDPNQTYNIIKQQLATGSATDKGAYNGMLRLEKQGLSPDQIIQRLQKSNGYIFN